MSPEQLEQAKELRSKGATYKDISADLGLAPWTVRYWLNPYLKKKASIRYANYKADRDIDEVCRCAIEKSKVHATKLGYLPCCATVKQLVDAYQKQEGTCALCEKSERVDGIKLHMDHDHKTGKFRGWLCYSCNRGLALVDTVGLDKIDSFLS